MDTLLPDILSIIFIHFDTKQLIWASRTCKKWRKIYHDNLWRFNICLTSWANKIQDKHLESFKTVRTISLQNCQITDMALKYLKNAQIIDLTNCYYVTDIGLKELESVIQINLEECYNITDSGLEYIKECKMVNLYGCYRISELGLTHFKTDCSLILCGCCIDNFTEKTMTKFNNLTFRICEDSDYEMLESVQKVYPKISIMNENC
ncbi:MAG: F-box domain protein [Barrevirus sp.]|uniref:F-box domain protein n=1 Tax=Barrevirus sp. TaxID=2487763 RepID=A0A3G4ZR51_9VIRU|nr:MAG: F-box domain protein [Barrevirus sp.]